MGSELSGVDEELRSVVVRDRRQLGQRPDLARDVRGSGDRDEVDPRSRHPQRVLAGSAAARTLIASVVLRTSTTVPSRAPTNSATAPRAAS
jgi:hypothetical protein